MPEPLASPSLARSYFATCDASPLCPRMLVIWVTVALALPSVACSPACTLCGFERNQADEDRSLRSIYRVQRRLDRLTLRLAPYPNRLSSWLNAERPPRISGRPLGRGEEIRTPDLLLPKQERYRCATPRASTRLAASRINPKAIHDQACGRDFWRRNTGEYPQTVGSSQVPRMITCTPVVIPPVQIGSTR